tara:strand:+ start:851 stop:1102 length:252 start_codon:yes stop_codon:yes gene_type:complete
MNKKSLEQEVGVVYGKIYGYTDVGGDSVLEFMDEWLEQDGKYDLFMEYICEDEFNKDVDLNEVKELIDLLYDILGGVREEYNM